MHFGINCLTFVSLLFCGVSSSNNVFVTKCSDCKIFPSKNSSKKYSEFATFVQKKNTPVLYVGVSDALLTMTVDGQLLEELPLPRNKAEYDKCVKSPYKDVCGNIVGLIVPRKKFGTMFACASISGADAKCWETNGTAIIKEPVQYVFFNHIPRVSFVADSFIFQGYRDDIGIITRLNIYAPTESDKNQELRLKTDPHFVSIYNFGNFIYYFFTELSEELPDDGSRVIYARVGRSCKYDKRDQKGVPLNGDPVTFSKARLLCKLTTGQETKVTTYYNNLTSTSFIIGDGGEVYIYGLFRAARPGGGTFAVCRYTLSAIDKVFEDKWYYNIPVGFRATYTTVRMEKAGPDDPKHLKCDSSIDTSFITYNTYEKSYKVHSVHAKVIFPDTKHPSPLIVRNDPTITHLLADSATIVSTSYHVIRLFNSVFIHEVFVPQTSQAKKYISVRKISDDPLRINEVKRIKFNGVTSVMKSTSFSSNVLSTTSVMTPKPSSTQTSRQSSVVGSLDALNSTTGVMKNVHSPMLGNGSASLAMPSHADTMPTNSFSVVPTSRVTLGSRPPRTTDPSNPWAAYIGQERIVVAARKKMVFVPLASCGDLTSCKECVAATNPYCGWHENACVQLNSIENRPYLQDIKNGDYSKVCPPVDVSCELVQVDRLVPKMEITLHCLRSGLPAPRVTNWTLPSPDIKREISNDSSELKIHQYTLKTAGTYICNVSNGVTSNSCSIEIPGSEPEIKCETAKSNKEFLLTCIATGYPQPEIELLPRENQQAGSINVTIEAGKLYQPIAYNPFGAKSAGVYEIVSISLDFELSGKGWDDKLSNKNSGNYLNLKKNVKAELTNLYKDNNLFQDIGNITFRQGSVIASVEISGLKTPSSDENDLIRPLLVAIKKGKIGDLEVSEPDRKDTEEDQQSTNSPIPASTRLPETSTKDGNADQQSTNSPILASTRLPKTSTKDGNAVARTSSNSGVAVWLLILLLIIIGLIVFVVGYCCGLRGLLAELLNRQKRTGLFSEEDGNELKGMSRSEKTRESERMLLGNKNKNNREPECNDVSKHGSGEIKQNDDEDGRPPSNHSTC